MAYGLKVYGSNGVEVFSSEHKGWCLIDSWSVGGGTTTTKYYPEWSSYTVFAHGVGGSPFKGSHIVNVSGTTVTATRNPDAGNGDYTTVVHVYVR